MGEVSQAKMAQAMQVSESTISGFKSQGKGGSASIIEHAARIVASLGLKLIPADAPTYSAEYVQAIEEANYQLVRVQREGRK
jgi:transcriptional regulator with XRE-family HTH domain